MKKSCVIWLVITLSIFNSYAQEAIIKGRIRDGVSFQLISGVNITIENTNLKTETDALGEFSIIVNVLSGDYNLQISKTGYITKRYPISFNENTILNLNDMTLERDISKSQDLFTITLSDDELDNDNIGSDNVSGLLSSSLDVFQRTAAFEFSSSFYKLRGLDSDNGIILINGIAMNKLYNGRPQWSNWGGLNDVMRSQELAAGLAPSNYSFGGILGTTNINTRASEMKASGRLTYSSSNRSYTNRLMVSYASGLLKNNWAYTLSLGRRWGHEGYQDATTYKSNSFFISAEKTFNQTHSLNFTGIYAPNTRGKSSPNTQEVYDLKGIRYNEYWGLQDGKKRNSRLKKVEEPILMLNYYWNITSKMTLNTNLSYQFGTLKNSRLAFAGTNRVVTPDGQETFEGGGRNPSPTYYQKLPSYFERNFPENLEFAYGAEQAFLNDGQINWDNLYEANLINASQAKNATYMLYNDVVNDAQIIANTILTGEITNNILLNAGINYKNLNSENYAQTQDLLGGTGFLNVDSFDGIQFDLKNPNKILQQDDIFSYHYKVLANEVSAYAQAVFKYKKIDFYTAVSFTSTQYQRDGIFQNENFEDNSFGKGEKLSFTGLAAKGGITYKFTGAHLLNINAAYTSKAPSIRNSYTNSRFNHNIVPNISEEKIMAFDASYIYRKNNINAKLTGYYMHLKDANEISFFFADGIGHVIAASGTQQSGSDDTEFIQEILTGIEKQHLGVELGIEAQVTTTIKLKGVASLGQFTYANNPDLYLSSDRFENAYLGTSKLKNYKLAAGPHQAYSVGFEYRDPDFWWFGATANFFRNTYIDVSPLTRTDNFFTDTDGLTFTDYNESIAQTLLKQEQFDDYMSVNLIGGKSWKIKHYYIGFFASINNLLDAIYKTGGFEQGRNANYRQLRDDKALDKPVFGSKYWYGRGATYFLNMYVRF